MWDAITNPCLRYLLLAPKFSYDLWRHQTDIRPNSVLHIASVQIDLSLIHRTDIEDNADLLFTLKADQDHGNALKFW